MKRSTVRLEDRADAALRFPPGVYRHRDGESPNALKERWAAERFRDTRRPSPEEPPSPW